MNKIQNQDLDVLKRHNKAICHLRERKKSDRLALFIGAGVSKNFGLPSWEELISRIEKLDKFKGLSTKGDLDSLSYRTQALIQHLKKVHTDGDGQVDEGGEKVVMAEWLSAIHECLYSKVVDEDELLEHPYLECFLNVIKDSPLTINYNFDDCIERMLAKAFWKEQEQADEKIYETVWEPSTQYKRSKGVIYHPNGFLPRKLIVGHSERIVFAEGEFADQLIQSMHGHYSTLVSHLSRYTSLLIGLSLNDPTLRHLLRQNTHLNPGHVHYWFKYCEVLPSEEEMKQEREVNYEVYGIVTIHLLGEEYKSFGRLLECSDEVFAEATDRCGALNKFVYYITGAVGAGKSSVVSKMKSLSWYGEWIDDKPEELAKPHTELSSYEREKVDRWVSEQFRKKDFKILNTKVGIIISDRSPIDPLAFVNEDSRPRRCVEHLSVLSPNEKFNRRLAKGCVILLSATAGELLSRAKHRHRKATDEYLNEQQEDMRGLYGRPDSNVVEVSTCGRSLAQVVRYVARIIHLETYEEYDIHSRIEQLSEKTN